MESPLLNPEAAWSAAYAYALDNTYPIDDMVYDVIARCGGRERFVKEPEDVMYTKFINIYTRLINPHPTQPNERLDDREGRSGLIGAPARPTAPRDGFDTLRKILHP